MSLLDLLLTFNFRAGNGRQAPERCIIENELLMRTLTDMYYRILTAPPGYPPDQNFMLVQYQSLEYASNCGFVAWNGELRGTLPMIHPSGEAIQNVINHFHLDIT